MVWVHGGGEFTIITILLYSAQLMAFKDKRWMRLWYYTKPTIAECTSWASGQKEIRGRSWRHSAPAAIQGQMWTKKILMLFYIAIDNTSFFILTFYYHKYYFVVVSTVYRCLQYYRYFSCHHTTNNCRLHGMHATRIFKGLGGSGGGGGVF